MTHRTFALHEAITRLTDDERKALSQRVKEANKRSEEGRGGGRR
ncbi:hypothetical protein [Streptomyces sp. NPDC127066]